MNLKLITVPVVAIALASCATFGLPSPKTPAQGLYEAETAYAAALSVAVQYRNLPACGGASAVCSDPSIVTKLQQADAIAKPALNAAIAAVQTPGFGTSAVATTVAAATQAVQAFIAITSTLNVK